MNFTVVAVGEMQSNKKDAHYAMGEFRKREVLGALTNILAAKLDRSRGMEQSPTGTLTTFSYLYIIIISVISLYSL